LLQANACAKRARTILRWFTTYPPIFACFALNKYRCKLPAPRNYIAPAAAYFGSSELPSELTTTHLDI
ncbi:hypothetical protein, partial [Rhizobium ecuadorense]|uniref:hypothetical protein n=1 Tax=Rhizobium ecuadorense TaxID=1671795 RepID=UPI001AEBD5BD